MNGSITVLEFDFEDGVAFISEETPEPWDAEYLRPGETFIQRNKWAFGECIEIYKG